MNRVMALRVSLLMAMGIVPFACGGDDDPGDDPHGGAGEAGGPDGMTKGGEGGSAPRGGEGGAPRGGEGGAPRGGEGGAPPTAVAGQGGMPLGSCTAPEADPKTGLVRCAEGYQHRPRAVACGEAMNGEAGAGGAGEGGAGSLPPRADGSVTCRPGPGQGGQGGAAAASCTEFYLGFCDVVDDGMAGADSGHCASGCVTDQDCGPGFVCWCGSEDSPSGGICRASDCTTDADCGEGFLCASYDNASYGCGRSGIEGFACQTAEDECGADAECPLGEHCLAPAQQGSAPTARACDGVAACGRPFLVEATARLAPLVLGSTWHDVALPTPALERLSASERAVQAQHWARLGQMEHASIAAFARFGLQLLSLAAPAELVEECTRALADETTHARLCFQLASAYAGEAIGPGPLDVGGSLPAAGLLDVVELVIHEGCLGETVAALDASEAAAAADDPALAAVYARIAEDEQRHAALAFRFLRWALGQDLAGVRQCIQRALRELPATVAARGVVEPCLRALAGDELLGRGSLRGGLGTAAELA